MRFSLLGFPLIALPATAAAAEGPTNLLSPAGGLMFWTLIIFGILLFVLSRYAYRPLLTAVEAREAALEAAIASAQRDRDEASKLLAEQIAALTEARNEAQRFIAEGRVTAEKLRTTMIEESKQQAQEMLGRAQREISSEKTRAIAEIRREAIDLAIAGASKVIGRNMDDAGNRKLVDEFLAAVPQTGAR